jgi:peptidyl-prolyl cis-trans isomerase D
MISWMQKHKKWLVVTIWISTIAFVGAGFVGWGSYDFGKSQGTVAKVGDREIGVSEVQNEYSNLYNQYAQLFGDQFNQEVAKRLNLEEIAFQSSIQKALLLNFADEIGLDVTDTEIAKELLRIPSFQKDGKFDKAVYVQVLNQNRTNPSEFEANLKSDLLVQKVRSLFNVDVNQKEIDAFAELYGMQDDINVEVVDSNSILVPNDEAKLKEYWEAHKEEYMSNAAFELETYDHPISSNDYTEAELKAYFEENKIDFRKIDGKLKTFEEAKSDVKYALDSKKAKKEALRTYLKIKKGEVAFAKKEKIFENQFTYPIDSIKDIKAAANGDILKPFENKDVYTIVKVVNKIDPQPLPFVEVRNEALKAYRASQKRKILLSQASQRLKHFKGTNIKAITPDYSGTVLSLNTQETKTFVNQLFSSSKKEGMIKLDGKVVLYRINDSIITPVKNVDVAQIQNLLKSTKENELFQNLIEKLQTKYGVVSYMEKGE